MLATLLNQLQSLVEAREAYFGGSKKIEWMTYQQFLYFCSAASCSTAAKLDVLTLTAVGLKTQNWIC